MGPPTLPGSPEHIVEEAFTALLKRDGSAVARLSTPASVAAYHEYLRAELNPKWRTWTAEELSQYTPGMPEEVARWRVAEMETDRELHSARILQRYGGLRPTELENLPIGDVLTRAMVAMPEAVTQLLPPHIIGHVREGTERCYVLFRFRGFEALEPVLAALSQVEGHWRIELDASCAWGLPGFSNLSFSQSAGA